MQNREQTRSFLIVINFLSSSNLLLSLSGVVAITDLLQIFSQLREYHLWLTERKTATRPAVSYLL